MSELDLENHRKSKLPPSALKLPGMDILQVKTPQKQRFSLQPGANKSIDLEAKLLLPSQILNHQPEPPKLEKVASVENPQVRYLSCNLQDISNQCHFFRRNFLNRVMYFATSTSSRYVISDGCPFSRFATAASLKSTCTIV